MISFRLWDEEGNQMIMSDEVRVIVEGGRIFPDNDACLSLAMLFTTKRDYHGNPIYQKDILRSLYSNRFYLVDWHDYGWYKYRNGVAVSTLQGSKCFFVVGNVYENPELLELVSNA